MKPACTPKLVCIGRVSTLTRSMLILPANEPGSLLLGLPV